VAAVVRVAVKRGGEKTDTSPPSTLAAAAAALDWAWLASFTAGASLPPPLGVDAVGAGGRGAVLRAAYASHDALLVQTAGASRLLLAPPDAFAGCAYPFPVAHPADGASMVDWADPDAAAWPAFSSLRCWTATLAPGDALLVPAHWAAHWELPPDAPDPSAALIVSFAPAPHRATAASLTLAAARAAEVALSDALSEPERVRAGVAAIGRGGDVRAWLRAVGVLAPFPAACPPSALALADALDAAAAALEAPGGRAGVAGLARALCARRLRPTPWLETPGVDDAARADVPTLWLDDRSEEERKYPMLFRREVEAKVAARREWRRGARVEGAGRHGLLPAAPS
jgi:hypothetical protein